jgi:hypothetical protein
MTRRILSVTFGSEAGLLDAVADLRGRGHGVLDVLGPYAVHGLPEALGQRPSRLPWICLAAGLVGLLGGLTLQLWTSAVDWPLDVGGKPTASWPAFVPVAFELTVLAAGLATVAAFLVRERGTRPRLPETLARRATDDRFVIVAEARGAGYDAVELAEQMRERFGALEVDETLVELEALRGAAAGRAR